MGEGSTRIVYLDKKNPEFVIKRAKSLPAYANWREFLVSHALEGTRYRELFAKVHDVSRTGRYLVMQRMEPLKGGERIPSLPNWFTDRKPKNLGREGCYVRVLDYAQTNLERVLSDAPCVAWPSGDEISEMAHLLGRLNQIESEP